MGELPIIVEGYIDDPDIDLIELVNEKLTKLLGIPFQFSVNRMTRVTEELTEDGFKERGFVCVWID